MPYIKPPNSGTPERITGLHRSASPTWAVAKGLAKHFGFSKGLGKWLVDQAIESLTESPYNTDDCPVAQEAIHIATRMGYITDPAYIQLVHDRCVRNANQSKSV